MGAGRYLSGHAEVNPWRMERMDRKAIGNARPEGRLGPQC